VNQSEKAYRLIKDKIVRLELRPLAVLNDQVLMDCLHLGRTPIREALHRLATEDLVIIAPRRGMFVADVSITDLQKMFELRILLEGYCAQLAAQRASEAQISEMEDVLSRLDLVTSANSQGLMGIDQRLHQLMYEAANNKFLSDELNRLHTLSMRLWYLALDRLDDLKTSIEEHHQIVQALKEKDGAQAERLIQQHILGFQQRIRAAL
jgi:DNA-binding GntR family transcriptional regulator